MVKKKEEDVCQARSESGEPWPIRSPNLPYGQTSQLK